MKVDHVRIFTKILDNGNIGVVAKSIDCVDIAVMKAAANF